MYVPGMVYCGVLSFQVWNSINHDYCTQTHRQHAYVALVL